VCVGGQGVQHGGKSHLIDIHDPVKEKKKEWGATRKGRTAKVYEKSQGDLDKKFGPALGKIEAPSAHRRSRGKGKKQPFAKKPAWKPEDLMGCK